MIRCRKLTLGELYESLIAFVKGKSASDAKDSTPESQTTVKQKYLPMDELEYLAMSLVKSKGYKLHYVSLSSMAQSIEGRVFELDRPLHLSKSELDALFAATENYPMHYIEGEQLHLHFIVKFVYYGQPATATTIEQQR